MPENKRRKPKKGGENPQNSSTALIVVERKSSTGRKCKICTHPSVNKINSMIAKGESFRRISSHFMTFSDRAVGRHAEKCLRLEIRALIQENKIQQAVNHYEEIREQLQFSKELQEAAREILTCDEIGRISFAPRAIDVDVIYDDLTDLDDYGSPQRKIRNLQAIINKLSQVPEIRNLQTIVKWADLKDYALRTIDAVDKILDKFARIEGRYQKDGTGDTEADELKKMREIVQRRAESEGISYEEMLIIFNENYKHLFKPEVVEKLISESVN